MREITRSDLSHWTPPKPHSTRSLIHAFVGPRGSGKSCAMVDHLLHEMNKGYDGYANIAIKGPMERRGKFYECEAIVLDYLDIIFLEAKLKRGVIGLDEINLLFDALEHNNVGAKQFTAWVQQIRKYNAQLYFTTIDFGWANKRLRGQTDLLTYCRDMSFSQIGRECGFELGQVTRMTTYDLSGSTTGVAYSKDSNAEPAGIVYFESKYLWRYFDSMNTISRLDNQYQFTVKKRKVEIDVSGEDSTPDYPEDIPDPLDIPENDPIWQRAAGRKRR